MLLHHLKGTVASRRCYLLAVHTKKFDACLRSFACMIIGCEHLVCGIYRSMRSSLCSLLSVRGLDRDVDCDYRDHNQCIK